MTVASMTAFARSTFKHSGSVFNCEIKSVNHRYLEPSIRLPDSARFAEFSLRQLLKDHIARGKIDVTIDIARDSETSVSLAIQKEKVEELLACERYLSSQYDIGKSLDSATLLRWPGVLQDQVSLPEKVLLEALTHVVQEALLELKKVRQSEGRALKTLIEARLDDITLQLQHVEKALPDIKQHFEQKLKAKLDEVAERIDTERLAQEIVYFCQKIDVDEELDRLHAHLKEVRTILNKGGVIGRRLDFMMQELNREANTLGSKSVHEVSTQAAVAIKVAIEQMREQIQNIE